MGVGCYVGKSDFKAAFRNLPIRPEDRKWLVMMVRHPITNKQYYFMEKCLPFGSSISCSHFQRVSDAIKHIYYRKSGYHANNYLDDFLLTALIKAMCDGNIQLFLDICKQINFPVSIEKMFLGEQIIVFLGMLLDTVKQTVSIPLDKRDKALQLLWDIVNKRKATVLRLQQLAGLLNFIARAVVPRRHSPGGCTTNMITWN